jgi:hypothetical protein
MFVSTVIPPYFPVAWFLVVFLAVLFLAKLVRPFVQMLMSAFSFLRMANLLLRVVNSNTQSWRVRVRIVRYWEHLDAIMQRETMSFFGFSL